VVMTPKFEQMFYVSLSFFSSLKSTKNIFEISFENYISWPL
jgi:hypothetical protein